MDRISDVAIVGAGPYGLSLASHLRSAGVSYRIFGQPMQFWEDHVPHGTFLKSDGESSDLVDPAGKLQISSYYMEQDGAFSATKPIAVERFTDYGRVFQKRLVPDLDRRNIAGVTRSGDIYRLTTDDGEVLFARKVVLAVGINAFRHLPETFAHLPAEFVSHSAQYGSVAGLAGRRVAVIGSGASAIDVAAVSHEAGADTTIISSRESIAFHPPPAYRRLRQKIRRPDTGIGAGWSHWFYVNGPDAFRLLPTRTRMRVVTTALGPSPGWFMKDRILGHVPVRTSTAPRRAVVEGGQLKIELQGAAGASSFCVDHVVAATGFRIDMQRLGFLDGALRSGIRTVEGAPVLSSQFQTSVPGLYVIGPAAAFSFGPVMRFVYGAGFTTPRIARHLVRAAATRHVVAGSSGAAALATAR